MTRLSNWALVFVLTASSGCVEVHRTIGDQCSLSTECAAPLACRLGRCRNGCAATRDCDLGTYCTLDQEGLGSCLVPDEARCALDSECPSPLVCRMGRCANVCNTDRDCPSGARCEDVDGEPTCVDESEKRCVAPIDCDPPRICGPFQLCAFECVADRDCDDGPCLGNRCAGTAVCTSDADCDDADFCNGAERCDPADPAADARGCAAPLEGPCDEGELCDADADACLARCDVDTDLDDDGHDALECGGDDCDDEDPDVHPRADERCNTRDDDCDEASDEGFDLQTDAAHCGTCGNACSGTGGAPACSGGSCTTTCAAGFDDCDGLASNGCETELSADALHCGACNDPCPLAQACAASTCGPSPIVEVAAGEAHTCARRASGGVLCWGDNTFGQLGDGTTTSSTTPVAVLGLVDATEQTTCAIRAGGRVWCWGDNRGGQLGDGTTTDRSRPVPARAPPGVTELGLGDVHTCARTASRVLACWGLGSSGQLGADAGPDVQTAALVVSGLQSGGGSLEIGDYATCVSSSTAPLRCVGRLPFNFLGSAPGEVAGGFGLRAVSSVSNQACGLVGGELRCWGRYTPSINAMAPEVPPGASGLSFEQVGVGQLSDTSVGSRFVCGLTDDGRVRCLGNHSLGQLGDGTAIATSQPTVSTETLVTVAGLSDAVDLAVGNGHTCAARSTGGVVCWGRNHAGQLGNGSMTVDRIDASPFTFSGEPSPVEVVGLP